MLENLVTCVLSGLSQNLKTFQTALLEFCWFCGVVHSLLRVFSLCCAAFRKIAGNYAGFVRTPIFRLEINWSENST